MDQEEYEARKAGLERELDRQAAFRLGCLAGGCLPALALMLLPFPLMVLLN